MQRFRDLTSKAQLYTSLVKTRLTYPFVPWAAQQDTVKCKMQAVQTKGVSFIRNYQWQEFRKAKEKSELQKMPGINTTLQLHAARVRQRL